MTAAELKLPLIRSLDFFSDLSELEITEVLSIAHLRHCASRDTLFTQGDPLTHAYIVCRGAIQLFRVTQCGREVTSDILIEGDVLFDLSSLAGNHGHISSARAVKDSLIMSLPLDWLRSNLKTCDDIAMKLATRLSARLLKSQVETEQQATMNAAQIIACYLQHLCVSHGLDPQGFDFPYSQMLMASRLGMDQATFSRTLPKLVKCGIRVKGSHVVFEDVQLVEDFVCGGCTITQECDSKVSDRLPSAMPKKICAG